MLRLSVFFLLFFGLLLTACNSLPQKNGYVVTSPEAAEIMAVLNLTSQIKGVTAECNYPAALHSKPQVGSFGKVSPEKIAMLNPTLVVLAGSEQDATSNELKNLGFKTVSIFPQSVAKLMASIKQLGEITNTAKRADTVVDSLLQQLEQVRYTGTNRPKVYVEIYNEPLMSCSDSSFVGQLVELAGGDNIFSTLPRPYSRINAEDVINAAPDIIIVPGCHTTSQSFSDRLGWEDVPAVKNGRIYTDIDPDLIVRAAPRFVQGVAQLKKVIHPKGE